MAPDGLTGQTLIREKKPDLIISDICMPGQDGLNMIAALKSEFPDMEVTILTGYRDFDYAQRAIRLGVSRFLLKPSNLGELNEAVETMVHNRRRRGQPDGQEPFPERGERRAEKRRRKLHRQQCGPVHAGAFPGKDHPSGGGREDLCEPVAFKQAFKPPHGEKFFRSFKQHPH